MFNKIIRETQTHITGKKNTSAVTGVKKFLPILSPAQSSCLFHLFSFGTNLFLEKENKACSLLWESGAGLAKRLDQTGHSEGAACTNSPLS